MSPRRNRPQARRALRPAGTPEDPGTGGRYGGFQRTENWRGDDWCVRHVAGASAAGKTYRCPGCDQEIGSGTAHVVAWPDHAGVDERRHWHTACWNARERRGTRALRTRNAPRY